jgi:putative inorganic carbon (HCO3(-)) transporter
LTSTQAAPLSPLSRVAFVCAAGSTVAILISIAASQILLGLALAALLVSRTRLRLPPVWLPLALFLAGTVLSLAFSGNPAAGLPQVRKIYVYLTLLAVFSTIRRVSQARILVLAWAAVAAASGVFGVFQFLRKVHAAHSAGETFYQYYLGQRITGFMSHWQTFGGEEMIVLLMLVAFLMYSPRARRRGFWLGLAAAALLAAALLLGYTRGVWLATASAGVVLLWFWKRRLLLAVPFLAALVLWVNPASVRTRFESSFEPGQQLDSNAFRVVCWRTGLRMIRAHPWLGLGPEMVGPRFMEYVPPDIPRPLPLGWYRHLHNIYMHYAAERGIPTALALVAALLMMLWNYARALRRLPPGRDDRRFLLLGAIAVVIAVMVAGLFEVNLGDSEVLTMFLSVAALGYLACEEPARA